MIKQTDISNFGPIEKLGWNNLGPINLVIGRNGSGKTFILKSLYTALRTLETYQRGDDRRTASDILADKLYWTFQADTIGELVRKGSEAGLSFAMRFPLYLRREDNQANLQPRESHPDPANE